MTHDGLPDGVPRRPPRRPDRGAMRPVRVVRGPRVCRARRTRTLVRRRSRSCAGTCARSSRASSGRPAPSTGFSGEIAPPNEPGMALSVYGDAGWGREVQRGREVDGAFSDDVVGAAATAIGERWHRRRHRPGSRACRRRRAPGYGRGVRAGAGAAARSAVRRGADVAGRGGGAAGIDAELSPAAPATCMTKLVVADWCGADGPVLLVDDIVDAGWTLTVAGVAVAPGRQRGRAPVRARRGDGPRRLSGRGQRSPAR